MSTPAPEDAAKVIAERAPGFTPRVGIVLGSGLGGLAERIENPVTIRCMRCVPCVLRSQRAWIIDPAVHSSDVTVNTIPAWVAEAPPKSFSAKIM